MTLKELQDAFETEDGKAVITDFINQGGYKTAEEIAGLEAKKQELLSKVAKSQAEKKAMTEVFNKYSVLDFDDLDGKLATLAGAQTKESELEKMARRLELIERSAKESEERASREKALRADSEKKAQIVTAMKNAHVDDGSIDVLYPYFAGKASVVEEDGKINLIVESDEGQSPFTDYLNEWSKTDTAKRYIKAPSNVGGGSSGPGGATGSATTLDEIEKIQDRDQRLAALEKIGAIKT